MTYTFNKQNFKNYLHKNCHRNWFNKSTDNATYKTDNGTYDVKDYSHKYTVRVKEILYDPSTYGVDGQAVAGGSAMLGTAIASGIAGIGLAPFTMGGSLLALGNTLAATGMVVAAQSNIKPSRTIYFTITGDGSRWEVSSVEWHGISEVAKNICKWSNEVYTERYINQAYFEYRPPTP